MSSVATFKDVEHYLGALRVPTDSSLPIPFGAFSELEHYEHGWFHRGHYTNVALITLDKNAGKRNRYTVLRLQYEAGILKVIGRELDIYTARAIARRGLHRDGQPLSELEIRRGHSPKAKWRDSHGTFCCEVRKVNDWYELVI